MSRYLKRSKLERRGQHGVVSSFYAFSLKAGGSHGEWTVARTSIAIPPPVWSCGAVWPWRVTGGTWAAASWRGGSWSSESAQCPWLSTAEMCAGQLWAAKTKQNWLCLCLYISSKQLENEMLTNYNVINNLGINLTKDIQDFYNRRHLQYKKWKKT